MAENTNQANMNPVQVTQEPAVPTGEQKTPTLGQVDQGAASIQRETSPTESTEGLPNDVSERTKKEFEKLKEQLRTEREARLSNDRLFSQMPTPPVKPDEPKPLYDPTTGLLNEGVFSDIQKKAYEAEERAKKAEAAIQSYQQQTVREKDEQQLAEAHTAYPELDPKSKIYDKDLFTKARSLMTDSMVYPNDYGGKPLSYKEAADKVKGVQNSVIAQARQEGAQEAIEELTPKEQASLEATGNPTRRTEVSTPLPDLRSRSRRGDLDAIVQRLRNVPVVGRG